MRHIVVRPHSVIDVITNSSSELFIIKGDQDVEIVKSMLQAHGDYEYAIHKIVKLNTQEELDAMIYEMLDDIVVYDDKHEHSPYQQIMDVLYANDIYDEDKDIDQYRVNAMKELIKVGKIKLEHELQIGDIIICGKENSLYGDIADVIRKNFKIDNFFGSLIS